MICRRTKLLSVECCVIYVFFSSLMAYTRVITTVSRDKTKLNTLVSQCMPLYRIFLHLSLMSTGREKVYTYNN